MRRYVSIDCDDVSPINCKKKSVPYKNLQLLNDMGYKPTVFVPANYHGIADLRKHREWLKDILKICHVQAHGLHHRGFFGDCEFHTSFTQLESILENMMEIWRDVEHTPTVLRPPGWNHVMTNYSKYIKHLSIHDEKKIEYINIHEPRRPKEKYVILHSHVDGGDNNISKPEVFYKLLNWLKDHDGKFIYSSVGEIYDMVKGEHGKKR